MSLQLCTWWIASSVLYQIALICLIVKRYRVWQALSKLRKLHFSACFVDFVFNLVIELLGCWLISVREHILNDIGDLSNLYLLRLGLLFFAHSRPKRGHPVLDSLPLPALYPGVLVNLGLHVNQVFLRLVHVIFVILAYAATFDLFGRLNWSRWDDGAATRRRYHRLLLHWSSCCCLSWLLLFFLAYKLGYFGC